MRNAILLPALSALLRTTLASPISTTALPLPVIIWHGLGDRFDADGLRDVSDLLQTVHPGINVQIIGLGDDGPADQRASFLGNLTSQVSDVCDVLSADPTFAASHGRIDALGFSQGGLFLRGLAQTCPGVSIRNLVTFGSPHNGISAVPECGTWDLLCKGALGALKANKWSDWVQGNVVPAQYFRETDPETGLGSEEYLERSGWLANVNNEHDVKDWRYKRRIANLEHFVLFLFEKDQTLLPKETSWFADVDEETKEVTELRDRLLYKEDWLGLKELDEKGGLEFKTVPDAGHMDINEDLLRDTFKAYYGPESGSRRTSDLWSALNRWRWQDVSLVGMDW